MATCSFATPLCAAYRAASKVSMRGLALCMSYSPSAALLNCRLLSSSSCSTPSVLSTAGHSVFLSSGKNVRNDQFKTRVYSDASQSGAYVDATSTVGSGTERASDYDQGPSSLPKLVIFGGNGFVGSRVCEEALKTGLGVVSINRSGPPKVSSPWVKDVEWVRADVFDVSAWQSQLEGAIGVVSTLGAFGSNDFMYKICGESNVKVFEEAAAAGVPRAVFVSVHDYGLPEVVLSGYFKGKRRAEEALFQLFPTSGVALRPGFIYGTRYVSGVGVPLGIIGSPLEKALSLFPTKTLAGIPLLGAGFVPPVSVEAMGRVAVSAATDSSIPPGIMDVWQIEAYGNKA
eukprot:jgi/Botrbrau1/13846/Bobra.0056s0083.1